MYVSVLARQPPCFDEFSGSFRILSTNYFRAIPLKYMTMFIFVDGYQGVLVAALSGGWCPTYFQIGSERSHFPIMIVCSFLVATWMVAVAIEHLVCVYVAFRNTDHSRHQQLQERT